MALVKNIKETVTGLDIYNAIRNDEVSDEFRNRIPEGTLTNLKDVAAAMEQYTPSYNEFMDALMNRIGLTILNFRMWSNPLSQFKRKLEYGQTVQEIQTDLIKAVALNFKDENNPFAKNIPDIKVVYHNVDKQNTYVATINEDQVRTAFLSWDGIKSLTDSIITSCIPLTTGTITFAAVKFQLTLVRRRRDSWFLVLTLEIRVRTLRSNLFSWSKLMLVN